MFAHTGTHFDLFINLSLHYKYMHTVNSLFSISIVIGYIDFAFLFVLCMLSACKLTFDLYYTSIHLLVKLQHVCEYYSSLSINSTI